MHTNIHMRKLGYYTISYNAHKVNIFYIVKNRARNTPQKAKKVCQNTFNHTISLV